MMSVNLSSLFSLQCGLSVPIMLDREWNVNRNKHWVQFEIAMGCMTNCRAEGCVGARSAHQRWENKISSIWLAYPHCTDMVVGILPSLAAEAPQVLDYRWMGEIEIPGGVAACAYLDYILPTPVERNSRYGWREIRHQWHEGAGQEAFRNWGVLPNMGGMVPVAQVAAQAEAPQQGPVPQQGPAPHQGPVPQQGPVPHQGPVPPQGPAAHRGPAPHQNVVLPEVLPRVIVEAVPHFPMVPVPPGTYLLCTGALCAILCLTI